MAQGDIDFRAFAQLRGKEARPTVRWGLLVSGILFLAGFSLLLSQSMWADEITAPGTTPQHVGVIQNKTKHIVSVPSANSGATLMIPPGGWIEYTFWTPQLDLTAYVNGQPYFCRKITAAPNSFQQLCKSYDFLAQIESTEPVPQRKSYEYKDYKKKHRIKKTPTVG